MDTTKHPGQLLRDNYLVPLGITPYALARGMGVHLSRITRLIAGERAITLDTATRLGLFFDVPTRWWLEMQIRFDEKAGLRESLASQVTPLEGLDGAAVGPNRAWWIGPPKPRPDPMVLEISPVALAQLQEVARGAPTVERQVVQVTYPSGARALVGEG